MASYHNLGALCFNFWGNLTKLGFLVGPIWLGKLRSASWKLAAIQFGKVHIFWGVFSSKIPNCQPATNYREIWSWVVRKYFWLVFKTLRDFKYLLSVFEHLAFSIGCYVSLVTLSIVHSHSQYIFSLSAALFSLPRQVSALNVIIIGSLPTLFWLRCFFHLAR